MSIVMRHEAYEIIDDQGATCAELGGEVMASRQCLARIEMKRDEEEKKCKEHLEINGFFGYETLVQKWRRDCFFFSLC